VAVDGPGPLGDDDWPPGLLALKGGDLSDEIEDLRATESDVKVERLRLEPMLGRNGFFGEKEIVAVRA